MWRALKTYEVNIAFIYFLCALLSLLSLDLILVHRILQPLHIFNTVITSYISFISCSVDPKKGV